MFLCTENLLCQKQVSTIKIKHQEENCYFVTMKPYNSSVLNNDGFHVCS